MDSGCEPRGWSAPISWRLHACRIRRPPTRLAIVQTNSESVAHHFEMRPSPQSVGVAQIANWSVEVGLGPAVAGIATALGDRTGGRVGQYRAAIVGDVDDQAKSA